jgi:hypothetical protein
MTCGKHRAPLVALLAWLTLIVGTSSTVVRPQEFFDFLHAHVFTSNNLYQRFQLFWGVSWFTIVKGWHAAEFAVLLWLCVKVVHWRLGTLTRRTIAWSMVLCFAFAVTDEWHQSFVPDRLGTITDVLIDSLGVLIAGLWMLRQNGTQRVEPCAAP